MQQLCGELAIVSLVIDLKSNTFTERVPLRWAGYETVIRGESPFCHAFVKHDWLNFEYSQDLYYYYQLGQHNKWTAALVSGNGTIQTSRRKPFGFALAVLRLD